MTGPGPRARGARGANGARTGLPACALVLLAALAGLGASGCSATSLEVPSADAGGGLDAGPPRLDGHVPRRDGGARDAGQGDAGPPEDASLDAGALDAGAPDAGPPPELLIGRCVTASGADCAGATSGGRFAALGEGEAVPVVIGPQGGAMLVLAVRVFEIDPGDASDALSWPRLELAVIDAAGATIASSADRPALVPRDGGFEVLAVFAILAVEADAVIGRPLRVRASVADRDGVTRRGEVGLIGGAVGGP